MSASTAGGDGASTRDVEDSFLSSDLLLDIGSYARRFADVSEHCRQRRKSFSLSVVSDICCSSLLNKIELNSVKTIKLFPNTF